MLSTIPQAPDPEREPALAVDSKGTQGKFLGLPSDTELDNKILKGAREPGPEGARSALQRVAQAGGGRRLSHPAVLEEHRRRAQQEGRRAPAVAAVGLEPVTSFTNVKIVQQ